MGSVHLTPVDPAGTRGQILYMLNTVRKQLFSGGHHFLYTVAVLCNGKNADKCALQTYLFRKLFFLNEIYLFNHVGDITQIYYKLTN